MPDPFDFSDTSDLPADVSADVARKRPRGPLSQGRLLEVLKRAPRPVTAQEICIASHRLFGKALKLHSVTSMLGRHARDGLVVRVSRGCYALSASHKPKGA